jgi:hypothetical protein
MYSLAVQSLAEGRAPVHLLHGCRGDAEADDNSKQAADMTASQFLVCLPSAPRLQVGAGQLGRACGHAASRADCQHMLVLCCAGDRARWHLSKLPCLVVTCLPACLPACLQCLCLSGGAASSVKFMPLAPLSWESLGWLWGVVRLQGLHNLYGLGGQEMEARAAQLCQDRLLFEHPGPERCCITVLAAGEGAAGGGGLAPAGPEHVG